MVKYFVAFLLLLCLNTLLFGQKDTLHVQEELITIIGQPPIYKEDLYNNDLTGFIQSQIIYPEAALKDSIEGMIYISFWIDTVGSTSDYEVIKGIRKDLDEEALRVAKLIKFDIPATQRGKPIKVKYTVPVKFVLPLHEQNEKKRNNNFMPYEKRWWHFIYKIPRRC